MKKPGNAPDKLRSQRTSDEDDESDVDKFEDDEDDLLDDEELAVLEGIRQTMEDEENTLIDKESWDCAKVQKLIDKEINLGVSALTKVCYCYMCPWNHTDD